MIAAARFVAVALASLAFASCSLSVGPKGSAPAHPERAIVQLLQQDVPLVIRPRDLRSNTAVQRALVGAGLVVASHFSAAAIRQSTSCDVYDENERGTRCFTIARRRFVRIVERRVQDATLDREGAFVFTFSFRAIPISKLGQELASSRVFLCADARDRAQAWSGSDTTAFGAYYAPFPDHGPAIGNVLADCPINPELGTSSLVY